MKRCCIRKVEKVESDSHKGHSRPDSLLLVRLSRLARRHVSLTGRGMFGLRTLHANALTTGCLTIKSLGRDYVRTPFESHANLCIRAIEPPDSLPDGMALCLDQPRFVSPLVGNYTRNRVLTVCG